MIVRTSLRFLPLSPTASETGGFGSTAADPASLANQLRNATWLKGPEANSGPRAVPADASVPVSARTNWTY
jgi:hypothetical protein